MPDQIASRSPDQITKLPQSESRETEGESVSEAYEARKQILRLLRADYSALQVRRGQFSLRSYARKLGIASPILVQVMNEKRAISRKLATSLLARLDINASQALKLAHAIPQRRKSYEVKKLGQTELPGHEFEVVSDWWYFAILSLADLKDFRMSAKKISERLNISLTKAKRALVVLESLGLVEKRKTTYISTGRQLTTLGDVPSVFVVKNHAQGLELANEALHHVPVPLRDFSSITVATSKKYLPQAKELIAQFRRDLDAKLEAQSDRDSVYRMQIQLFPLTRSIKSKTKTKTKTKTKETAK